MTDRLDRWADPPLLVLASLADEPKHGYAITQDVAETMGVRLLRADQDRGALLLERLGRPLHELGLPLARRHEILCATAERVWRPAPASGLPTGADKGRWLIGYIETTWPELDRPCSERAVEHALACAARRVAAHDDERAVLVHGDVHQWNVLEAPREVKQGGGFKLVDPDGLLYRLAV